MVYFSASETSPASRTTLGYVFIVLFIVWLCLNLGLIIWQALSFTRLVLKRSYYQANSHKIYKSVDQVAKKLRKYHNIKMTNKGVINDSEHSLFLVSHKRTKYGGSICKISEKKIKEDSYDDSK